MPKFRFLAAVAILAVGSFALAQKKPLDHSVYDGWKSVQGASISRDGSLILYRVVPQEGDAVLQLKRTDGTPVTEIARATNPAFSRDGKFVVATVVPKLADTKKARRDKAKPEDMPKNDLAIYDVAKGTVAILPKVTSYDIAEEDAGWILYRPEPPKPEPAKPAATTTAPATPKAEEPKTPTPKAPTKKADHKAGDVYVLRNLATGEEERLENVASAKFSRDGKTLVFALSTKDGAGDGLVWLDLASKRKTPVMTGMGHYTAFALDKKATRLAFTTDKDDYAAKKPAFAVYSFVPGGKPELLAKEGTAGVAAGYVPAGNAPRFSEKGGRILFGLIPKPVEEKKDETPDDEKVSVDIWNWQDPTLQPQQLLDVVAKRATTYDAIAFLDTKRIVTLESPEMPSVQIADRGDGDVAIGTNGDAYDMLASWDTSYADYYLVDVRTGKSRPILKKSEANFAFSPTGRYLVGYKEQSKEMVSIDTRTLETVVLNRDLPYPIYDEENDVPAPAGAYGMSGWLPNDERVIVSDRYDLWAVDPTGKAKPVCVTNSVGRNTQTTFRYVRTDPEAIFIDPSKSMLLMAANERTRETGIYRDGFGANAYPEKVILGPKTYSVPVKAKDAKTVFFTRQDFVEYPDVWVADDYSLGNPRRMSEANPQQKEYNWGKAELVQWTSNDGTKLQGILIKPEDFDYGKKYPMITYFYERNATTLYTYRSPAPSASTVNLPYFASNGYLIFIPDINYKEGYPGESAMSAIMPGIQSILARGYVDPKRLAIQGQSWGGYQVAYMVTETNMFRCAFAGAPVSDMFSAYGGIRWGSGLVRQFQYEKTQSRIAGTPWDKPLRFLENSPIFFADKVQTPLLIMSNDKDGSVPWYQGIEMFTALRRLSRPSWLLVYNNEDHNLVERKNRKDLSIRMQQFFDHYLKDAPMPVWMKTGIPAVEKGKTMGFETPK